MFDYESLNNQNTPTTPTTPATPATPGTPNDQNERNKVPYPSYSGYGQQSWQSGQPSQNNQTVWAGSNYRYSAQNQSRTVPASVPASDGKKKRHLGIKIVACVLAALLISGVSIGGFAALVSNGIVHLGNSGSGNTGSGSNPAFTINKLMEDTESSVNTTSELTLQEAAKKVIPSVVSVLNYQKVNRNDYLNGSWRSRYSQNQQEEEQETSEGSGIIAASDGYIITNAHVVENADSLYVVLYDGRKLAAELIGSDTITDLAVLKVDSDNLIPAEFGSSSDMQIADQVLAIGNPGGLGFSTTIGYVSALDRPVTASNGYTMECIQTDAAINPGNSGGALVNIYGQVIGINSSKISATEYEGLGFAIPIDTAQSIVTSLKEYGYVKDRAVLGINGKYLDAYTASFYGMKAGMYVGEITNESVANAGITMGCVITKIDDVEVDSQTAITAYLVKKKPGDVVTLTVYNALTEREFTAKVTLIQTSGQ